MKKTVMFMFMFMFIAVGFAFAEWDKMYEDDPMTGEIVDYMIVCKSNEKAEGFITYDYYYLIISKELGLLFYSNLSFDIDSLFDSTGIVRVKFDDGDVNTYELKIDMDEDLAWVTVGNEITMMRKIATSDKLTMEITPLMGEKQVVTFDLGGFEEAMEWLDNR